MKRRVKYFLNISSPFLHRAFLVFLQGFFEKASDGGGPEIDAMLETEIIKALQ